MANIKLPGIQESLLPSASAQHDINDSTYTTTQHATEISKKKKSRVRFQEVAAMNSSMQATASKLHFKTTVKVPSLSSINGKHKQSGASHADLHSEQLAPDGISSSSSQKVDDNMDFQGLKDLEIIFKEAANESGDGLDIDQFRVAMKQTMGEVIGDTELNMLFMKVDTNCDGTVDWDEYLSYMLLEFQEKENMIAINQDLPFPNPMLSAKTCHLESICRITMLQAYSIRSNGKVEMDSSASRYMSMSKEGVLNVWNMEWQHQKTTILEGCRNNHRSVYFTDVVCMSNCNSVAVASSEYEISFYTMTSNMFQKKFQIKDMEHCALTLDFNFNLANPKKSVFLWGDTNGSVYVIRFYDNPSLSLFSSTGAASVCNRITLTNLMKGLHNLRVGRFPNVHPDWVEELRYFSNPKGQECFISCCLKEQGGMVYADISEKLTGTVERSVTINRRNVFFVRSGVRCLSYDDEWNAIVTGSRDFNVRVWNPFVHGKATVVLKGHATPVLQIHVRSCDHHIISISRDKNVRVWDMRDYSCKQSIHGRNVGIGRLDVTAMFYNEKRMELAIANNNIGLFVPSYSAVAELHNRKDIRSHSKAVSCVKYNSLFKQLVTVGDDGMVCVWDIKTGEKLMQFMTEKNIEITSMTFDPTNRRLITGLRNGSIHMWNFNNGAKLRSFKKTDNLEVSGVVFARHRIVASGWNKDVTTYVDSYNDDGFRRLRGHHQDDILSMDYHKSENLLATASYDGYIYIWSLASETVILALNMHLSILPMQLKRVGSMSKKSQKGETKKLSPRVDISLPSYLPWVEAGSGFYDEAEYGADRAVNKILLLQERKCDRNVAALISASSNGWVAAWSLHQRGGYFNAVKIDGETVVTMDSDASNEILLTGDSSGYIRIWKIANYCNGKDVEEHRSLLEGRNMKATEEAWFHSLHESYRQQYMYVPMSDPPTLQMSIRGHLKAITSLAYMEEQQLIASGSTDYSVRLWTVKGRYIGTFGQKKAWELNFPIKPARLPVIIPDDIRRVASPNTLQTIRGGYHSQWRHVKTIVTFSGTSKAPKNTDQAKNKNKEKDDDAVTIKDKLNDIDKVLLEESSVGIEDRRKSITVWVSDAPHCIAAVPKPEDKVETCFQKLQQDGIKSEILGKINYKPKLRLKNTGLRHPVRWCNKSAIVYSTLPYSELEPVEHWQSPSFLPKTGTGLAKYANTVIARKRIVSSLAKDLKNVELTAL